MTGIFDLRPHVKQFALLEGWPMVSAIPENNRMWWSLNFYATEKSRKTAAKKRKRLSPYSIYVTWEFTLEDVIKQGEWLLVQPSDKVLLTDKLDILKQLSMETP